LCVTIYLHFILSFLWLFFMQKKETQKRNSKKSKRSILNGIFLTLFLICTVLHLTKKDNIQIFFWKEFTLLLSFEFDFVDLRKVLYGFLEEQSTMTCLNSRPHHKVHSFFCRYYWGLSMCAFYTSKAWSTQLCKRRITQAVFYPNHENQK
jgi:hypothetical protein